MPQTSTGREISPQVAEELQTQYLRIKAAISADRLWQRVLTEEERQRLGGDLEACWRRLSTAGMWMELRGVSRERAVIEVAGELGFLTESNARWLLREIGEESPASQEASERPSWHPERSELRWGAQVIRRVRLMANPSNIQLILDAFQAAGWPSRIDDPLPNGPDQQRLHQAVLSLNEGLDVIRFHVQEGGQAVTWSVA